jgi:iron-regulated transporter 1
MSGIGNMIAMERDWIPVVADLSIVGDTTVYTLTRLNAVMRRIDLACKLVAPIVISAIVIGYSVRVGILVVAVVNALSWAIELWCTQRVWRSIARLRAPKITEGGIWTQSNSHQPRWSITRLYGVVSDTTKQFLSQLRFYFSTNVWIPSLALSILHINVLTYRDTFVTYLLAAGFSLTTITIARTCGSIIEVSSTYIAPVSIDRLAETRKEEELESGERLLQEDSQKIFEKKHDIGLTRSGLWGIVFQFANLVCDYCSDFEIILTGLAASCYLNLFTHTRSGCRIN